MWSLGLVGGLLSRVVVTVVAKNIFLSPQVLQQATFVAEIFLASGALQPIHCLFKVLEGHDALPMDKVWLLQSAVIRMEVEERMFSQVYPKNKILLNIL